MANKYLDDNGLAILWDKIKARDNSIVSNSTVYGAIRDGAGNTISTYYIPVNQKGANNGVATLGNDGKIPSTQLPSYVDDVLEYNNLASFPSTGEAGKIYVAKDTNKTYRWSGSQYTEISASPAAGRTSSTYFQGDWGKAVEDNLVNLEAGLTISGNKVAKKAERATNDANGNTIHTYYAPRAEMATKVEGQAEDSNHIKTNVRNDGNGFIYLEATDDQDHTSQIIMDESHVEIQGDNGDTLELNANGVFINSRQVIDSSMALTTAEINAILV